MNKPPSLEPIVIIAGKLTGGGQERVIVTLANAWARQGRRVILCVLAPGVATVPEYVCDPRVQRIYLETPQYPTEFEVKRQERIRIRSSNLGPLPFNLFSRIGLRSFARWYVGVLYHLRNRRRLRALRAVMREVRPSVVLAIGIFANLHAIRALRGLGIRLVISERNDPDQQRVPFPMAEMRQAFYDQADVVTANSTSVIAKLARYVAPEKLVWVPNPLYSVQLPPEPRAALLYDAPTVLIMARLVSQKNHRLLLDAFAALPERHAAWRLAVAGEGSLLSSLQARAKRLHITDRVDWYGHVTAPEAFYQAADIFVLPSLYEGQPNALLEAMHAAMPVVVSNIASHTELVVHEQNGLCFAQGNVDSLVVALTRLMDDAKLRERLGVEAVRTVESHRIELILPRWEQILG